MGMNYKILTYTRRPVYEPVGHRDAGIVERNDRVELIPLKQESIKRLRDAVGDTFDKHSIADITFRLDRSHCSPGVPCRRKQTQYLTKVRY
jgi:hypothetical protein